MNVASGITMFVLIWWGVFFAVLPWGVRLPERPEKGHAPSAPVNPRLGLKALVTTAIAAALWAIAYWIIASDLLSFREAAG
jgi:predicted secreted protein